MTAAVIDQAPEIRARKAGFFADLLSVAGRAVRSIPRDPESIIPALIVPIFFYAVNLGSAAPTVDRFFKSPATFGIPPSEFPQYALNAKQFFLPVAIIFAVTGVSRASALVTDIQDGYFDRLLMTPIKRLSLLLGLMIADFTLVVALTMPVLALAFIAGTRFETGVFGVVVFVLAAATWGLVFTGFPYAIALKTGNPAAVNSSFILFFPFAFLTTSFLPQPLLTGWLQTVAKYNPVTYLLEGLRSLTVGWYWGELAKGFACVLGVGVISIGLALLALRSRVRVK